MTRRSPIAPAIAITVAVAAAIAAGSAARGQARDGFELRLPTDSQLAVGGRANISLTIAARQGFTVSRDGPVAVALSVEPAQGLELPRRRYRRNDAVDAEADAPRFELAIAGKRAGRYQVAVEVRFWLCGKRTCRPIRASRQVTVDVAVTAASGADAGTR